MLTLSRGSAGRTIGLLGVMFTWAVKRKLMAVNPCSGIEKPKDAKRNRRLSEAEYAQLGTALKGGVLSDIFLFLAVTGFRSGEARNLRWSELDLERSIVTLEIQNQALAFALSAISQSNYQKTVAHQRICFRLWAWKATQ